MRHKNRERLMACLLAVLQLAASAQQANLTARAMRLRPAVRREREMAGVVEEAMKVIALTEGLEIHHIRSRLAVTG